MNLKEIIDNVLNEEDSKKLYIFYKICYNIYKGNSYD